MTLFKPLDEFGFHQELARTPGTAIVMFTGEGCASCRAWKRLLELYGSDHDGIRLFEVDAGHAQALAREFSVHHLPALFLYRDGEYHAELQCEARREALDLTLTRLFSAEAQDPP